MEIEFKIDDVPATFSRDWFTGNAVLLVAGQASILQSAWNLKTHFSVKRTRSWKVSTHDHTIVIEKVRPLLLAGLRPHAYRIFIDNQLVAEKIGY